MITKMLKHLQTKPTLNCLILIVLLLCSEFFHFAVFLGEKINVSRTLYGSVDYWLLFVWEIKEIFSRILHDTVDYWPIILDVYLS